MFGFARLALGVVLAFGVAGAGWAFAQPVPGAAGPRISRGFGPCSEDVRRLCGDVKPGQGRTYRCLREKESELTPACRDFERKRRAESANSFDACRGDVERFCAGIRPGRGKIAACLKSHQAELSPACREDLSGR